MPRKNLTVNAPLHAVIKARLAERDRLYAEVRSRMTAVFRECSPDPDGCPAADACRTGSATNNPTATVRYDIEGYAGVVVGEHGRVIVGWPSRIPFLNFDTVQGVGNTLLHELVGLLDANILRFEPASPDAVQDAKRKPPSVHPDNRPPSGKRSTAEKHASPPATGIFVTPPLVLHPDNLSVVGLHLNRAQLSAAGIEQPRNMQREDTGRVRKRDLPVGSPPPDRAQGGTGPSTTRSLSSCRSRPGQGAVPPLLRCLRALLPRRLRSPARGLIRRLKTSRRQRSPSRRSRSGRICEAVGVSGRIVSAFWSVTCT
ncbi:hypothetical protein C8Q77DRAFT_1127648 [Trametes polyzona]|nr:hypothetical protein C8Q77DRAFT_1127648 [Trametes polyzona]